MQRFLVPLIALAALLSVPGVVSADSLPPPRPVATPVAPPVHFLPPPSAYYRVSAYAHWQNYGVDRQGYFRPLVVYEPGYGAYYRYNGQPYPWMTTNSLNIQPSAVGTPYRNYMPYAQD
jgi:hypothetical protein